MPLILVVDDTAAMRLLIKFILERAGYSVVVAASGQEALTHYQNHADIKLIISDLAMPGMDGLTLLENLPADNKAPFLIVTASGQEVDKQRANDLGAAGIITKPFSSQGLTETVSNLLST